MNTRLNESLDGIETVKSAAQEYAEIRLFGKISSATVMPWSNRAISSQHFCVSPAGSGAGYWFASRFAAAPPGHFGYGQVVGYYGVSDAGFSDFISLFAYSQISFRHLERPAFWSFSAAEDNLDQNVEGYAHPCAASIEFRDVCFGYTEQEPI
jgi:ABC-type multidrug transport system fused ATPase/permease subunit